MKVCLLFNPKAGTAGRIDPVRQWLAERHRLTVAETRNPGELTRKAGEATRGGFEAVAVAGGDGTLHAVVCGFGPRFPRTPLAVLPLGTGNDFCRTLAIPLDPLEAARLIRRHHHRAIDVARVEGLPSECLLNAATAGFSGRVAGEITPALKKFWGPLAYLRGAAGPIADPVFYRVSIRFDDGPPEEYEALNVVVANGRTAAGGLPVAPLANPEDGLLDVVIVKAGDLLDASAVAAALMAGDYLTDENVVHRRAKRVQIVSDPPLPYSVDGELCESDWAAFEVVPKALQVYPGRDYRPDPRGRPVRSGGLLAWLFSLLAGLFRLLNRALRWPGVGVAAAVLALATFAWLSRGVLAGNWLQTNAAVFDAIRPRADTTRTELASFVTRFGDPAVAFVFATCAAALFAARRGYATAVASVAVLLCAGATELILKPWFAVPRPDLFGPPDPALGFGNPSGHALRSVALAGFLAATLVVRRPSALWRWFAGVGLWLSALAVCWSRVYLGLHSFTDVLGGGLLGLAWAALAGAAALPYQSRRHPSAEEVGPVS